HRDRAPRSRDRLQPVPPHEATRRAAKRRRHAGFRIVERRNPCPTIVSTCSHTTRRARGNNRYSQHPGFPEVMTYDVKKARRYRRFTNRINKLITGLQRLGIVFGPMELLTVTGRRTGQPRTFPIAVLPLTGGRYIVQAFPNAAWVANARAADTVT